MGRGWCGGHGSTGYQGEGARGLMAQQSQQQPGVQVQVILTWLHGGADTCRSHTHAATSISPVAARVGGSVPSLQQLPHSTSQFGKACAVCCTV